MHWYQAFDGWILFNFVNVCLILTLLVYRQAISSFNPTLQLLKLDDPATSLWAALWAQDSRV